MTGESLFKLIKSLSRQQRSNFSRFVEARKGKKQKFLTIFDRMLACNTYEEETIRGKEFKDARKYYQNRELLADKLIQSLVQYESAKVAGREYVLRAVEYNANELARKKLGLEVKASLKAGDYIQLLSYYDLRDSIADAYGIFLALPKGMPESGEVREMERQSAILQDVLTSLRAAAKSDPGEWSRKSTFIKGRLEGLAPTHPRDTYRYFKAQAFIDLLNNHFFKALVPQNKVVDILQEADFPLSRALLIKETSILIRLASDLGEYPLAMKLLTRLSEAEPQSPREEDMRQTTWIKSSVIVAGTAMDIDLALQCRADLLKHKDLFKESGYVIHLLGCARVCFIHGEYATVLEIVEEIRSLSRSYWVQVTWLLNALRCIIHYELENEDLLESILLASIRRSRKEGDVASYPLLIFKTVRKLWNVSPEESRSVLDEAAARLEEVKGDAEIQPLLGLLDFGMWVEAKRLGTSLLDLHERKRKLQREGLAKKAQ